MKGAKLGETIPPSRVLCNSWFTVYQQILFTGFLSPGNEEATSLSKRNFRDILCREGGSKRPICEIPPKMKGGDLLTKT